MEILIIKCSSVFRRLRQMKHVFRIEEIRQLFDDVVAYLNKLPSDKRKNDGMNVLIVICDELASLNVFRLFDHLTLRNHTIFNYIRQTFEMLLIKSTHSQTISMTKQEEGCLDSTSYLIAQLCLFQNEPVDLFYGKLPTEILYVTEKPNIRDPTFDGSTLKSSKLMEKPNLKTARLPPNAPPARPVELRRMDITQILGLKKFPWNFVTMTEELELSYPIAQSSQNNSPPRKYRDVFLTKSLFDTLIRATEDLSRNEYTPCHVKYKVVNRLVRLCSRLDIVDILLSPIMKCLQSKNYLNAFKTVEVNQTQFYPKQLFFIYECPQFIIQHNFIQQEQVANSLCKRYIKATKSLFNEHFLATDIEIDSNKGGDRRLAMHVISCHLEFLYYLSMAPSSKQYFLKSSTIFQLLLILKQDELIKSAQNNKYLFNTDVGIIAYSLLLLCNLAYEKTILLKLKHTNLKEICMQLKYASDDTIMFASKMLITILNEDEVNENHEPMKLKEAYIKFLDNITNEPKQETRIDYSKNLIEKEVETKYNFLTESFMKKLLKDMKDMTTNEYPPNGSEYKEIVRRIHICTKHDTNEVEVLLSSVIACLNSDYYLKSYQKIDLTQKKSDSRAEKNDKTLAPKQIFYMRECPEFLSRHDYKRQKEISISLSEIMLKNTETIFNQCLLAFIGDEDHGDTMQGKNAQIEALSLYIKLLSHFALTPTVRKNFFKTTVIDQIFRILETETLINDNRRLINTYTGFVRESLTLLYNLAFDKEIIVLMKAKNLLSVCTRFSLEKDEVIQFTSQTLTVMLESRMLDELANPQGLCQIYVEHMSKSFKEPRRPYKGVKLRDTLHNLEVIIENDAFQESIVNEKEGISSITKCVLIKSPNDSSLTNIEKIPRYALNVVWHILRSIYGLKASKQLKSNDQFVEYVLQVSNQQSKKVKKISSGIIWKLGDERIFRSEHAEQERKRGEQMDDDDLPDIDDQFMTDDQCDGSNSFDLMISFSNSVADKIVCQKIYNRLTVKNISVYIEKQGQHRLQVIKKAMQRQKILLVCLSNEYRKSKVCMAEIEYAFKFKCPIIPVLADATYKPKGWLNHLIGEKVVINFTQKKITDAMDKLMIEINKLKSLDQ